MPDLATALYLAILFATSVLADIALQVPIASVPIVGSAGIHHDVVNGTRLPLAVATSVEAYTTLVNYRFPRHQIRVKKSNFCDPTVK